MTNYLVEDTANPVDDAPVHLWYGTIAVDVADFYTNAYVLLPDLSPDVRFGPCFWPRRDFSQLPTTGDRCVVMFDNRGQVWIVSWYPDEPAPFYTTDDGALQSGKSLEVMGYVAAYPFNAGGVAFATKRATDTIANRYEVNDVGKIAWGPGNAALDSNTNLYRFANNILKTDALLMTFAVGVNVISTSIMNDVFFTPIFNPQDGMMAIAGTSNRLYVRIGGVWKSVLLS